MSDIFYFVLCVVLAGVQLALLAWYCYVMWRDLGAHNYRFTSFEERQAATIKELERQRVLAHNLERL